MSEDEQNALKAWRQRQAFLAVALIAIIIPVCLGLAAMAILMPDKFLTSPAMVLLPVALLWAWLLHRSPQQWALARRDQRDQLTAEIRGPVGISPRRGIGIIAVEKFELRLAGQRFELSSSREAELIPGQTYTVRYAPLSRAILSISADAPSQPVAPADPALAASLTPRERDLIRLIARGLTDKEIARELNLSPTTVRSYNSALYEKLAIQRRGQVRAMADALGVRLD
ncbi:MAG: DNA-binding CsgD family transcriptional regulator [Maricaulis sp.]